MEGLGAIDAVGVNISDVVDATESECAFLPMEEGVGQIVPFIFDISLTSLVVETHRPTKYYTHNNYFSHIIPKTDGGGTALFKAANINFTIQQSFYTNGIIHSQDDMVQLPYTHALNSASYIDDVAT